MFWNELAAAAEESSLQKLLCTSDPPLQEVLGDSLMFQELRQGNKNLVEYLTKPTRLVEMTKSALQPTVDNELPIENQYKSSHMSAEVLTVRNIDDIVNAFVECPEAMEVLANSLGKEKLNSVTGIFYDKMITHLLSRHFPNTMALLRQTNFVENCMSCMELGSIACLVQKVDRIPTMTGEITEIKQYLVEQRLIPRLVELLDEKQISVVHDNAADTFTDILRNLRDVLFSYDDKEDALHDSFLDKDTITDLTNRMLTRDESGALIPSIVLNVSEMLLALIESNSTGNTPSQMLDCERLLIETPVDEERHEEQNRSNEPQWRPDGERIVETVVASHAGDILCAIIEDLQSDTPGNNWHCLLNLLVSLCDTNHLPTHHLLTAYFKSADFGKLFDLVWKHPMCTVFHRLLSKIVIFALFSNTGDVSSPLIDYFLNDCKLISRLSIGIMPICCLRKLSLMSLRAFHISLARFLQTARGKGSNTDKIDVALKVSTDWPNVEEAFNAFLEWNKPDLQSGADTSRVSYGFDQAGNSGSDDFESFCHFDSMQPCSEFDARVPSFPDSAFASFSVTRPEAADPVVINLRENDVEEKEFDSICSMKDLDNWPITPKKSADDSSSSLEKSFPVSWPGEEDNGEKEKDDCWDKRLSNGSGDDWLPTPTKSSPEKNNSSNEESKDEWADFGSAAEPLKSDEKQSDEWPGDEKSTDVEWPVAPVAAAPATVTDSWACFVPTASAEQSVPGETDA